MYVLRALGNLVFQVSEPTRQLSISLLAFSSGLFSIYTFNLISTCWQIIFTITKINKTSKTIYLIFLEVFPSVPLSKRIR